MFQEARLLPVHYIPDELEIGMMFLVNVIGHEENIITLDKVPNNMNAYIEEYGYPVKLHVIDEGNPNLPETSKVLANPEQIGWFDLGAHSDVLSDITLAQINKILNGYDGYCMIEMYEDPETYEIKPVVYEDKITLCYADAYEEDEYGEDDEDDYYEEMDEQFDDE